MEPLRQVEPVTIARFSPNGRFLRARIRLAACDMGFELAQSSFRSQTTRKALTAICFSPDGNLMLTTSLDHTACIWDLNAARLVGERCNMIRR